MTSEPAPGGYGRFAPSAPSTEDLSQLGTLVTEMSDAQCALAEAQDEVRQRQETLDDLKKRKIPELMTKVGMTEFVTTDGWKVKIKPKLSASVLAANRPAFFAWLQENGHGGMVKRSIEVGFAAGEQDKADALRAELSGTYGTVKENAKVESSTLTATVKRWVKEDVVFPRDLVTVYEADEAEIKPVAK